MTNALPDLHPSLRASPPFNQYQYCLVTEAHRCKTVSTMPKATAQWFRGRTRGPHGISLWVRLPGIVQIDGIM